MGPTLILVDGSSYIFRAYHAIPHMSNRSGVPTNAVFGVTKMLLRLIEEKQPTHLGVVMDPGGKNFRHEIFPEYKAHRPPIPDDLREQLPLVRRAILALSLPLIELAGHEADDVIATLVQRALEQGYAVIIVSGDKDLMQLVGDRVTLYDPMKEVVYDAAMVEEKMGVPPAKVGDLLALMGDASDNIPGVSGVGQKTAAKLLAEHESLEQLLAAAPTLPKGKLRERLIEEAANARLSRRLVRLILDAPVEGSLDELSRRQPDRDVLEGFLEEMEFSGLKKLLLGGKSIDTSGYRTILSLPALERLIARARETGECALDLETTSLDSMQARIVGISLCPAQGEAVYVPVGHQGFGVPAQLALVEVLRTLEPLWTDPGIRLYGQNIKYDAVILAHRHGIRLPLVACDAMIASYVLDPGRPSHGMDYLSREFLRHDTITYQEVAGKGKNQIPFSLVPVDKATTYSAEDADVTFRLCKLLLPKVKEAGLGELFHDMELPMTQVLMDMEMWGIRLIPLRLRELSKELDSQIGTLAEHIHQLAGCRFNINSPAQLREILFTKLGLRVSKKTKSGASTDSSVLEELSAEHELPSQILAYRSLTKLKSTYVDVLPAMINPETGRIHTRYNLTVAETGRLSSSDPNLQNIPVRSEMGRRIRHAFVASEGGVLLSADYSQVELRLLAHLCGDEALLSAFQNGEDIHARTASRIFQVPMEQVDAEMRRRAKAVNFGIVYGQGAFNLARQLQISRTEAKEIIENHKRQYPGVQAWVEGIHQQARATHGVQTLFGRRRFFPDILSSNPNARANAERMAQNTPIQGTAADIIKLAMIRIHQALRGRGLETRMVLQVHDELVFDVPRDELSAVEPLVRELMENVVPLKVRLTVDMVTGTSWDEAH